MVQIINDPNRSFTSSLSGALGQGFESGVQSGLQQLAQLKTNELLQKQQRGFEQQQFSDLSNRFQSLGLPRADSDVLASLRPQEQFQALQALAQQQPFEPAQSQQVQQISGPIQKTPQLSQQLQRQRQQMSPQQARDMSSYLNTTQGQQRFTPQQQNALQNYLQPQQQPVQQQAQQPSQQRGLLQALRPAGQQGSPQQLKMQQAIEKKNKPYTDLLAKGVPVAEQIANITNEMTQLAKTGKVPFGKTLTRITPTEWLSDEAQRYDMLSNELAALYAQNLGVATNAKIKLAGTVKPNLRLSQNVNLQALEDLGGRAKNILTKNQLRQNIIDQNNGLEPANLESLVEKQFKKPREESEEAVLSTINAEQPNQPQRPKSPQKNEPYTSKNLPSLDEITELSKIERGIWRPQSELGRAAKDLVTDTAAIMAGNLPASSGARVLGNVAYNALKKAAVPFALGEGTKQVTGSQSLGDLVKIGAYLAPAGKKIWETKGRIKQEATNALENSKNLRPENAEIEAKKLEHNLSKLYDNTAGSPGEDTVRSRIVGINNLVQGGRIKVSDLERSRNNINSFIQSSSNPLARGQLKQLQKNIVQSLEDYGKTNPQYWQAYNGSYEILKTLRQFENTENFIQENTPKGSVVSKLGKGIFGFTIGPVIEVAKEAGKKGVDIYKFLRDVPSAAKDLANIVKSIYDKDSKLYLTYLDRFDRKAEQYESAK